jgi:hypothetical protein
MQVELRHEAQRFTKVRHPGMFLDRTKFAGSDRMPSMMTARRGKYTEVFYNPVSWHLISSGVNHVLNIEVVGSRTHGRVTFFVYSNKESNH